jgi:hypothetical protein
MVQTLFRAFSEFLPELFVLAVVTVALGAFLAWRTGKLT